VRHVVEQVLLVREVPVQGWCLDVQLGGQASQRQPVQAGLDEQAQRGADLCVPETSSTSCARQRRADHGD
jgi:hypothetical protein